MKQNHLLICIFIMLGNTVTDKLRAQTDSVYWNFGTPTTPIASASTSSNVNVPASSCLSDTGNICCNLSTGPYIPNYLTNAFSSSTYPGASGQPTIRTACKKGTFNASTSTYISFTVTPNTGYTVTLKGLSFGGLRGTSAGPGNYLVRTSADGFNSTIASGTLGNGNYGTSKKTHTGLTISGTVSTPVEVRVYAYGTLITSSSGDFFVDDMIIYYEAATAGCSTPDTPGNPALAATTFYSGLFNWQSASNALAYEYAITAAPTPPAEGKNITDTFIYATKLTDTIYADSLQYFHVRSKCDTFASPWKTISFVTDTIPDCDTPTNIIVSGITLDEADIIWNSVTNAIGYQYSRTLTTINPSVASNTTDTFYHTSGMNDNTTYYAHVRATCIDSFLYSDWTHKAFTTLEDTTADTFSIVTYNVLNYGGSSREVHYRKIMDSIKADIVVVQELTSSTGFNNFLSDVLNFTTTTYSGATFSNGPDTDNGLYYKGSKFQFISNTPITTSLRDINQFKMRHIPSGDTLIIYSGHLKAGNTGADATQRAGEVDDLRAVTDVLPMGSNFIVCGDFNIYGAGESAYTKLIQNGSNVNGRFNDILSMSGTWNSSGYAQYHTQSTRGGTGGGMDDRFDMFLFSNAIIANGGFDILSGSYYAFGNDGAHYNNAINTTPYNYPQAMLDALYDASDHLPVVVKIKYNNTSSKPGKTLLATIPAGEKTKAFTVFPNPANRKLYIRLNTVTTASTSIHMYSTEGRSIRQIFIPPGSLQAEINISELTAGIYYIKAGNDRAIQKVIVQ